jgi:hypothetical protein
VQKQITDENNSKDDAKTKTQLVQTYMVELVALQAQLAQLEMQKQQNAAASNKQAEQPAAKSASSAIRVTPAGSHPRSRRPSPGSTLNSRVT